MYKNIIDTWIVLAMCVYTRKTNCNDYRKFYKFQNNKFQNKFLNK